MRRNAVFSVLIFALLLLGCSEQDNGDSSRVASFRGKEVAVGKEVPKIENQSVEFPLQQRTLRTGEKHAGNVSAKLYRAEAGYLVLQTQLEVGDTSWGIGRNDALTILISPSAASTPIYYTYTPYLGGLVKTREWLVQSLDGAGKPQMLDLRDRVGSGNQVVDGKALRVDLALKLPEDAEKSVRIAMTFAAHGGTGAGSQLLGAFPAEVTPTQQHPEKFAKLELASLSNYEGDLQELLSGASRREGVLEVIRAETLNRDRRMQQISGLEDPAEVESARAELLESLLASYRSAEKMAPDLAFISASIVQAKANDGEADSERAASLLKRLPYAWPQIYGAATLLLDKDESRPEAVKFVSGAAKVMVDHPNTRKDTIASDVTELVKFLILGRGDTVTGLSLLRSTKFIEEAGISPIQMNGRIVFGTLAQLVSDPEADLKELFERRGKINVLNNLSTMVSNGVLKNPEVVLTRLFDQAKELGLSDALINLMTVGMQTSLGEMDDELYAVYRKLGERLAAEVDIRARSLWLVSRMVGDVLSSPFSALRRVSEGFDTIEGEEASQRSTLIRAFAGSLGALLFQRYSSYTDNELDSLIEGVLAASREREAPGFALTALAQLPRQLILSARVGAFQSTHAALKHVIKDVRPRLDTGKAYVLASVFQDAERVVESLNPLSLLIADEFDAKAFRREYFADVTRKNRVLTLFVQEQEGLMATLVRAGHWALVKTAADRVDGMLEEDVQTTDAPQQLEAWKMACQMYSALARFSVDVDEFERGEKLIELALVYGRKLSKVERSRLMAYPSALFQRERILRRQRKFDEALAYVSGLQKADPAEREPYPLEFDRSIKLLHALKMKHAEEEALNASELENLPRVQIDTEIGSFEMVLFEDDAPNHTANLIQMIKDQTLIGTPFHRVIHEYVAQGGDPAVAGRAAPDFTIPLEKKRKFVRGTLGMARAAPQDSASTQIFIVVEDGLASHGLDTTYANPGYTAFGRVVSGMDVVAKIRFGVKITRAEVLKKRDHDYQPFRIQRR